jgi:hypothetical protein
MKIAHTAADQNRRALVSQLLHDEFARIHPLWVERHLAILTSLREMFGNDLDKPIILAVIGQFMFENAAYESKRYADQGEQDPSAYLGRLTNVESVATSAGLPRESVRRKVIEFIDLGWIKRDEKGGLQVTAKAMTQLDDTTQQAFRLLADLFVEIMAALEEKSLAKFTPTPARKPE